MFHKRSIAYLIYENNTLNYLYDGRGSVTELVNGDGQVTGKNDYEAFGITDHVGYLGNVGIHYENYYGYNGENYNERSGLQYLRARYYEPETGTFLTRDSYLGNIMNPLSQNRYSYAENNPIMNVDPSGHFAKLFKNIGSTLQTAKKVVSNTISTIKNITSNVVKVTKNIVNNFTSTVKQVFNNSYSKPSSSKSYSNTSAYRKTTSESSFDVAKNSTKNTNTIVKSQSKPVISTRNSPLEVVRKNIETVKKACEGVARVASKAYQYKEQILDVAQVGLDIAGMVPAVGNILDGVNGVISLARGRKGDAALNFASMIPVAGLAAGAGKLVSKGSKAVDLIKLADNTTTQSKLVMNLQNFGSKGTSEVVEKIAKNSDEGTKVIKNSIEGVKSNNIIEIEISRSKYPESVKHIEDSIANGKPEVLTIDRTASKSNRKASLKGIDKVPGKDLDEYPPAMFKEGGNGASVRPITPSDNRGAGATFGHKLRPYPNGSKIKYKITDD